jgi:hypothetical protein
MYEPWRCSACGRLASGTYSQSVCSECKAARKYGYEWQRELFATARAFSWTGREPSVLGTYEAEKALQDVLEFLNI